VELKLDDSENLALVEAETNPYLPWPLNDMPMLSMSSSWDFVMTIDAVTLASCGGILLDCEVMQGGSDGQAGSLLNPNTYFFVVDQYPVRLRPLGHNYFPECSQSAWLTVAR
jgi:hypothetical protein